MTIRPVIALLLFASALPSSGGDVAAPTQPPLARNLMTAAEALAPAFNGQPVAIIATRPASDGDAVLAAQATYLAKATTAALLRAGIRGLDAEDGHPLTVAYQKGKLGAEILFAPADAAHWQEKKKAAFVLQSTLSAGKSGVKLHWQAIDLVKLRPLKAIDLPPIPVEALADQPDLRLLPETNLKLLLFAGGNIGVGIDRGECWDLPAHVLKANGFPVPGYDFGREVPVAEALPGDVLSIDANGFHHVMLLVKPAPNLAGALIYHQNVNGQRVVVCDTFPQKMRDGVLVWRPGAK
jgi:hypothetical protein